MRLVKIWYLPNTMTPEVARIMAEAGTEATSEVRKRLIALIRADQ